MHTALRHRLNWRPFSRNTWTILGAVLCGLTLFAGAANASAPLAEQDATHSREIRLPAPDEMGPEVYIQDSALPTSPPPDPQVGDSWVWWLWVHTSMPPHFEQATCTVRGKTDHGYVVVDDRQWNVGIDQADVDLILERWENTSIGANPDMGIYELNSQAFGDPPDELDNDPRIYLVYFEFGISSDGFFFEFDQYPEGHYPGYHSNECESLYLNCAHGPSPSGDYMIAVAAHEFEHLIHWKYDENETSWVDEGMAEMAMWFYGHPDNISQFNSNADNNLTVWDGNWADYIQTYLWTLYFYERYGGGPALYDVVHEAANSTAGYENILDLYGYEDDFADVFANWSVANFLDDPSLADGRYGYVGDELPTFYTMGTYSSYPTGQYNRTVNHWGTDYYRFLGFGDQTSVRIDFDGADTNVFAVWGLTLRADGTTEVQRVTLDPATQVGSIGVGGLTDPADEVILVVSGVQGYGGTNYLFSAQDDPAAVDADSGEQLARALQMSAGPNPFRGQLSLNLSGTELSSGGNVQIYDATGRSIRSLRFGGAAHGSVDLSWDGRDEHGLPVPPGIYLVEARSAGARAAQRVVLIK